MYEKLAKHDRYGSLTEADECSSTSTGFEVVVIPMNVPVALVSAKA